MSDIMSMEQLVGSAQGLKNAIESTTKMHITLSPKSSSKNTSKHDLEFAQIKAKYFTFAQTFGVELDMFLNSVSQSIKQEQLKQEEARHRMQEAEKERKMLQEKKEKERLMEKPEIRTNTLTSLEIEDNLALDYSPASSVNYNEPNVQLTEPEPVQSRLSIPASPKSAKKIIKKEVVLQTKKTKTKKVIRKNAVDNKPKPKPKVNEVVNKPKSNPKPKVVEVQATEYKEPEIEYKPYEYNANRVRWTFTEVTRSSTIIFIGNLPSNIKVAAVQFFVMKKAKVTMRQIEETTLKNGARGKFALVRFRYDVLMPRIDAFINNVNTENNELFEKQKKNDNGMSSSSNNKNQQRMSWQKRVFLKHNTTFKYFESEQAMYQDPTARHGLYVRNFDILDANCHKELTDAFLQCGDLDKDIQIRLDRFGDPFCIAVFRNIEDAIYCCNSEILFKGRVLEMKYDRRS